MASRQQIKRRITSVKNTRQITKAMQLVAASKLRRAQEAAEKPATYVNLARDLLVKLKRLTEPSAHSFFKERKLQKRILVVITSDRGLAGAYNSNVLKRLVAELKQDQKLGVKTSLIVIGRHVARFAARLKDVEVVGIYQDVAEAQSRNELRSLIVNAFDAYKNETADAIDVLYTHYVSSVNQQVRLQRLLPILAEEEHAKVVPADFEPSIEYVLEATVERLIESQLYKAALDSFASEHSMRMMAMKNATDNASELVDDLTLIYNNARQASITQELAEITGGAEAMRE